MEHSHHQSLRMRKGKAELWKHSKDMKDEIVPNFAKDINLQIQEVEQTPNRINLKKSTSKYIVLKLLKYRDKKKKPLKERERNNILPIGRKQLD